MQICVYVVLYVYFELFMFLEACSMYSTVCM